MSEQDLKFKCVLDPVDPSFRALSGCQFTVRRHQFSNDLLPQVGTMYASSPFEGRKLGAGLIMETLAGRPLNPPFPQPHSRNPKLTVLA